MKKNQKRNTEKSVNVIKSQEKEQINFAESDTATSKSKMDATTRMFQSERGSEVNRSDQEKSHMLDKYSGKKEARETRNSQSLNAEGIAEMLDNENDDDDAYR